MGKNINILILSVGTRNKVVQYFKKVFSEYGNVIATDMSALAPAIYDADKYYIVPKMTDEGYLDAILKICAKEQISGVLSLIDPELSFLALHKDEFEAIGTSVIGSSYELCELSLNKYRMFLWLKKHGYNCALSYLDEAEFVKDYEAGKITFPVFVKPQNGSASLAINKVNDLETLILLMKHNRNLMIQEMLTGQEIGADVYIDMISGKVVSIFTKKKIKMRAGETDKSVSIKDQALFNIINRFVTQAGYRGEIDIDIFQDKMNPAKFIISEVNPRFGGGYPHAYESGVDNITRILKNLKGEVNPVDIGSYDEGIYMMKYNEVCIQKLN